VALTVHLVVTDTSLSNAFLRTLQQHLHDHFGIEHSTIQIENQDEASGCLLDRRSCC
jgi:cobalt-zinc-cadmium efflux system protein